MKKLAVMLSTSLLLGGLAIGCKKDMDTKPQETAPAATTPERQPEATEPIQAGKPVMEEPVAPAAEQQQDQAAAGDEEAVTPEQLEAEEAAGEEAAGEEAGDEEATRHDHEAAAE